MTHPTANIFHAKLSPLLPGLRAHALRLTRNGVAADDLVQDALTRAWRHRASFIEGSNLSAWLHRILFNQFVTGYRRRKTERRAMERLRCEGEQSRSGYRLRQPLMNGLSGALRSSLNRLPEDFRQAVIAVDIHGLSYREAATRLGCPEGTVMSRLHRGRRRLRADLGGYLGEERVAA
jgi:RNA polymerase sigma-70 factor (ECF subfamily)